MGALILTKFSLVGWKEIGRFVGVSWETVRKWYYSGDDLPVFKFKGQYRAKPSDLERWIRLKLVTRQN